MKLFLLFVVLLLAPYPKRVESIEPQVENPTTVTLLSPVAGSTVSNTITLSATASSSAAPISRVEFYMDDKLVGTIYNAQTPKNLKVSP